MSQLLLIICPSLANCSTHVDNHHLLPLQRHAVATAAAAVADPMPAAPADYQSRSTSQRSSKHVPAPLLVWQNYDHSIRTGYPDNGWRQK